MVKKVRNKIPFSALQQKKKQLSAAFLGLEIRVIGCIIVIIIFDLKISLCSIA